MISVISATARYDLVVGVECLLQQTPKTRHFIKASSIRPRGEMLILNCVSPFDCGNRG